ncbi:hypothetical protein B0H15DRAFT_362418 [Mycena belliarum]|uniref:Uncharacterized protein n=1 Tax=Mycena belliarum TaxID=1033014 RepID=A0AAD6U5T3_9AGAR|nr:hypothetical protein B0H15DRAFT_362418 [Mycena belliae]
MSSNPDWHTITIRVPFAPAKHALTGHPGGQRAAGPGREALTFGRGHVLIACDPGPTASRGVLPLRRTFDTLTVRLARLTVNTYLENVDLVVRS